MKPAAVITLASLALFVGWTQNSQSDWLKGIIYAGSGKKQLTDATGSLVTQGSFAATGNVTVGGTLTVTGAQTNTGALTVGGAQTNTGALNVGGALGVTGNTTLNGALTVGTTVSLSMTAAVTAAGSSKTDCTALTRENNIVTTATALQGVCLLTAAAGIHQRVVNQTAVSFVVYPLDAGDDTLQVDNFAALAADAGWVVAPRATLDCTAYTGTAWACLSTPGGQATVAAAGTTQATSTALASVNMNAEVVVTGANGTAGITLLTGALPGCISVYSSAITSALNVFGHNSDDDTIAGAAADAVFVQTARTRVKYCTVNGVAWLTY